MKEGDWLSKHRAKPTQIAGRVAQHGMDFHLAAFRAYQPSHEHPAYRPLPAVGLVNLAFACECYLKALIIHDTQKQPAGQHVLPMLFLATAPETQQMLAELYRGAGLILDAFEHFKGAFREWRYIYEAPLE